MKENIFNTEFQEQSVASKAVVGLERISEAFRVLLWDHAKKNGLSPIQIQILIFLAYHKKTLCTVSYLAIEFNLTKATVSDAVRVLDKKGYIVKDYSSEDSRSYSILLSEEGKKMVATTQTFANPIVEGFEGIEKSELDSFFKTLSTLIYKLNSKGILTIQRTCYGCKFYDKSGPKDYCKLIGKELSSADIRLDCPEFEDRA
jgi:DNA-binding MarR family transcriptional regulator